MKVALITGSMMLAVMFLGTACNKRKDQGGAQLAGLADQTAPADVDQSNTKTSLFLATQLFGQNGSSAALLLESRLRGVEIRDLSNHYQSLGVAAGRGPVSDAQLQSIMSVSPTDFAKKIDPVELLALMSDAGFRRAHKESITGAKGILLIAGEVFVGADALSGQPEMAGWDQDKSDLAQELLTEIREIIKIAAKPAPVLDSRVEYPDRRRL